MTAIVYSGTRRYFRQKSRRVTRSRWKGAIAWYCVLAIGGFFGLNWIYQVIRKPGEIFAPISASLSKSPESTWQSYGSLFEKHSTNIISPEFLAALAQLEGNGNPIAHTYWRWQWSWNPFEVYRPASSALGMFQITDGTFAEARKFCIRDHQVVTDGPWYDLRSCWFNSFYTRTLPSHSSEMTAALSPPERGQYAGCSAHSKGQPGSTTKAGCRDSPMRTKEGRDLRHARLSPNGGREQKKVSGTFCCVDDRWTREQGPT